MARHPNYNSAAWQSVRRKVLERDEFVCRIGLPGCTGTASAVDHIVEWADGGPWYDPQNLRATCVQCNTAKRNRTVARRARGFRSVIASREW